MRVAFISYEFPPDSAYGGIATYVAQVSKMFAENGHEVEVFASSPSRDEVVDSKNLKVHWIQSRSVDEFRYLMAACFLKRNKEAAFDVVEAPEYQADALHLLGRLGRTALVIRLHTPSVIINQMNHPFNVLKALRRLGRSAVAALDNYRKYRIPSPLFLTSNHAVEVLRTNRSEQACAQQADLILSPSTSLKEMTRAMWCLPESRCRVSPYPYTPSPNLLDLALPRTIKNIGFLGRLEKRKGIEVLVQAIPAILRKYPDLQFHFFGEPCPRPNGTLYSDWIFKKLGSYKDRIKLHGKLSLDQISEAYACLDLCIFPSLWENFPNVCLEAMAAGRVVVATNNGGMAEMLEGGRCGILIEPHSASSLALAVTGAIDQKVATLQLAEKARQRLLDAYNSSVVLNQMVGFFEEAIALNLAKQPSGN